MIWKIVKIVLGLLVAVVAVLWWMGKDMRYVSSEIEIAAPPEAVWAVLEDVNGWADWHSKINAASGTMVLNETLNITMIGKDGGDGPNYKPVITELTPAKYMRWRAKMMAGFIFTNDKIYTLEATATGTKVTHTEGFSGIMLGLMWGMMKSGVPPIIDAMNVDLKAKVEGG